MYGWNINSRVYHVIATGFRGWHPHSGQERWVDRWSHERPVGLGECDCVAHADFAAVMEAERDARLAKEAQRREAFRRAVDVRRIPLWDKLCTSCGRRVQSEHDRCYTCRTATVKAEYVEANAARRSA